MFCEKCGSRMSDDAGFCPECGQKVVRNIEAAEKIQELPAERVSETTSQGISNSKKKSKSALIIGVAVAAIVLVCVAFALFKGGVEKTVVPIELVQNGHLGEYTDITVKELLDYTYNFMYDNSKWDGGETDSGKMIVEVRYYDEQVDDGVVIQFEMLNDDCFKVSAFIDPMKPVEKATDLLAELNYQYMVAYIAKNRDTLSEFDQELSFIEELNTISGSAVLYGAGSGYSGDRASICNLDNEVPLDMGVSDLLDQYGYLDLSYYYPAEDTPIASEDDISGEEEHLLQINEIIEGTGFFITSEGAFLSTIYDLPDTSDLYLGEPYQYAVWDFDNDGEEEIMVEYSVAGDTALIDYWNDYWVAYYLPYRARLSPKQDGTVMQSSDAFSSSVSRFVVGDYGLVMEEVVAYDPENGVFIVDGFYTDMEACEAALDRQYDKPDVEFFEFVG